MGEVEWGPCAAWPLQARKDREGVPMSNIIVVGCGRVGSQLATMLSNYNNNVCVIDRNPASFEALGRDFNGSTFVGAGFDEDVLIQAGIEEADYVAAVTQSDNANLMVVEIALRLYDVPQAFARLYNASHENVYLQMGIDYVCGTSLVAEEMFSKIMSGMGDHIASFADYEVLQFALDLSRTGKDSIKASELERAHDIRVCAFVRADGSTSSIPSENSVLFHGDLVLVTVRHDLVRQLKQYMKK